MRYSITLASTVVTLALGIQAQNNWGADVTEGGAWGVSTAVAWGGSPTATAAGSASTDASAITAPSGAECVWREFNEPIRCNNLKGFADSIYALPRQTLTITTVPRPSPVRLQAKTTLIVSFMVS